MKNNTGSEDLQEDSAHGLLPAGTSYGLRNRRNENFSERFERAAVAKTANPVYGEMESHQFDPDESEVWRHHQHLRHFQDKGEWWTFSRVLAARRWLITLMTGFWIGVIALFVTYFTKKVTTYKFDIFYDLIEQEKRGEMQYGTGFCFLILYNVCCGIIAWFFTYIEPLAAGSGIPEVKCFLNGVNIPRIVLLKTLITKACGIIFSVSAGLPLGKEGPMVHIGAVVGAVVSQGRTEHLGFDSSVFNAVQDFRNDKEKRDFVACGAGAGVAAAFGAPMGGLMFSFEEGASFWSTKLTWRCFFCCLTTVGSVFILNSLPNMLGHSDNGAMFSFGQFASLEGEKANYSMWEFSMFMLVGGLGGIIGACFNYSSAFLAKFRKNYLHKYIGKLTEVILVTMSFSILGCILPVMWTTCTPLPVDMKNWTEQEKNLVTELNPLYCPTGTHYNELASLYLVDSDRAIKQLFHFREIGDHSVGTFSSASLFLFAFPYISMACIVSGITVPAGLFVPSLLGGAGVGRLVGHILHKIDQTKGTFADSGTYALVGAAAITGGITRITISLTLMILEATGGLQYVLPLMITVMGAFMVGNVFTPSVYEQTIHSRHLPHLEEEEEASSLIEFHDLTVADIMTSSPICLKPVVRVGEIYDTLITAKHHCFPVVTDLHDEREHEYKHKHSKIDDEVIDRNGKSKRKSKSILVLGGSITRKVLCTLIRHKAFGIPSCNPNSAEQISPLVNWETLECVYPDYPRIEELDISEHDRLCWLDLRPYIDIAPLAVNENTSVSRAYRMFRTLGLRHLIVTSHSNSIKGMVTRQDFVDLDVEAKERMDADNNSNTERESSTYAHRKRDTSLTHTILF